jgi:hypothetical protein
MESALSILEQMKEKNKKSSLSKGDIMEVVEILKKVSLEEVGLEKLPSFMTSFPSEVCIQTVLDLLPGLDDEGRVEFLSKIINTSEFDKHLGYMRQMDIAKGLLALYPHLSMYLILNLCEKATEGGNKQGSTGLLKKFNEVVQADGLLSLKLGESVQDIQLASLSIIVIGCLTEGAPDNGFIMKVLDWLKSEDRKILISKQMKQKIESDTKYWSSSLKNELLKLGLINNMIDADHLPSEVTITYMSKKEEDSKKMNDNREKNLTIKNGINVGPVVQSDYDKIRSLIDGLEAKSKRENDELLKLRADLSKIENIRVITQRRLEEAESSLSVTIDVNKRLEKTIEEQSKKIEELQHMLIQKESEHEKNRIELMDMSEHQSEFKTEVLKNKLRKKLRIEYVDFCEIESDEMTLQMAENIRMQVKNIFAILESEGISFDGGTK